MNKSLLFLALLLFACQPSLPEDVALALANLPDKVDYNFDVKPILADRCFTCHGPDENARKADLRLDLKAEAIATLASDDRAIVPGSLKNSVLVRHILSQEVDEIMPPPDSKLTLAAEDKAILIKWIDNGANYKKHWSLIPPKESNYDDIAEQDQNPIDYFVHQKLKQANLEPSPPSDPQRLLRRVFMDLTGLPPDAIDIATFENSTDPDRFEKIVDRLLVSSDCAERLAMEWMDVARYADSHGLHADGWRSMWPWRDYVLEAFQSNMPYDQFVTEQIAGDLLPNPTREQIIATAFHRNHPMTAEGGAIDEEFRLEYVADRTNTTATAILGLTMECAKCHDHKYDPISQEEYYQMSAFFNNVKELGMTGDDGNYGPVMQLASEATQAKIAEIQSTLVQLKSDRSQLAESLINESTIRQPNLNAGLITHLPMNRSGKSEHGGTIVDGNSGFSSPAKPQLVSGKIDQGLMFVEEYDALYLTGAGRFDVHNAFSTALWINTSKQEKGMTQTLVGNAGDKNQHWRGWDFYLDDQNRINVRLIHALPDNYLHVRSRKTIPLDNWQHVAFTYDGTADAEQVQIYLQGQPADQEILRNKLTKNIRTIGAGEQLEVDRALAIAKSYRGFTGENGIYQGILDELRIYERVLTPIEVNLLYEPTHRASETELQQYALAQATELKKLQRKIQDLVQKKTAIHDTIPEIMVMEEMPTPRATHVLMRGQYNSPMHEVKAGTPTSILPFDEDLPRNRLGLAQWLFSDQNPLTSRVTVNRYWQMIFGRGIVKSANDFGVQGSLPSHPELLDWLSIYFRESGWDLKALLKLIVMSDTYQQSSIITEEHLEIDPENMLLARSPSYRWPAEVIRDNALAASGLLVRKIGGPSVRPYQPEGLWIDKGTFSFKLLRYEPDRGDSLYRRSLYTFVKRTSPHPAMSIFDAPNRDVCTIQREVTNTPMQALVLLNDPQFVEASRALAQRARQAYPEDIKKQISTAFILLTGRDADQQELETLQAAYKEQRTLFANDASASDDLLGVGEWPLDSGDKTDLSALTMVANTIMNSDETYTRR